MSTTQAKIPSYVTLPILDEGSDLTILDFLTKKFSNIDKETWKRRIVEKKVLGHNSIPITLKTPYKPQMKLTYFKEVENEPIVPFEHRVLFENDHILICDKPHFLPVTPSGCYINESLLNRLKIQTGNMNLTPVHRLDRETAGVIIFSKQKQTRHLYHNLFLDNKIDKVYEALVRIPKSLFKSIVVKTRIFESDTFFLMDQDSKTPNSKTHVELIDLRDKYARVRLKPLTGKKHQLRLHMSFIGCPILNDRFYPSLQNESEDDFGSPLKLLARELKFTDPITEQKFRFVSQQAL